MIPLIVHTIWFQKDGIPEKYEENMRAVQKMNMDWQHQRWSDDDLKKFCFTFSRECGNFYERCMHMHQKIDLGRLAALWVYGGASIDMDVTPHRPLTCTPGLQQANFIVSRSARSSSEIKLFSGGHLNFAYNNAIIFCEPQSPYVQHIIDKILLSEPTRTSLLYFQVQWTTGPFMFTTAVNEIIWVEKVCREHEIVTGNKMRTRFSEPAVILSSAYFESGRYHDKAIMSHHHDNTWLPLWFKLVKKWVVKVIDFFISLH